MSKISCGLLGLVLVLLSCAALVSATLESDFFSDHAKMMAADPSYDPTLFARVPVRNAPNNDTLVSFQPADFKASKEAIEWCRKQGGKISYRQYSYISGPSVIAFGNKKAYCDMGSYTLTEVETLASPFLTLAQMAYIHPIPDWKWDRQRWGNPASQYCVDSKAATLGYLYVPEIGMCVATGWSVLPVEESAGLSNSCDFADGSSIEPWALLNGRLNPIVAPHFRTQIKGARCMR